MAETWGVPPWEIVERRGAVKWSRRFGLLSKARDKATPRYKPPSKKGR